MQNSDNDASQKNASEQRVDKDSRTKIQATQTEKLATEPAVEVDVAADQNVEATPSVDPADDVASPLPDAKTGTEASSSKEETSPEPEKEASPVAEKETLPKAEPEPSPEPEKATSAELEKESSQGEEEEASPKPEEEASPSVGEEAPPTVDKEASPAVDKESSMEPVKATSTEPAEEEKVETAKAEVAKAAAAKVEAPRVAFSEFDLQPALAKAIEKMGFTHCTPIQAQSLRYTLRGYDVTGKAQTGTGKTAAFLITLINDMLKNPIKEQRYAGEPRAIVLAPTRELVIQIASDADNLCQGSGLNVITLVGGEDYAKQLKAVDKGPVDIVVATPGRLIDFLQHEHLYLGMVELLVIDEADRMLDMGFIPQVRNIVARTPHKDCRQTLLFSATFTPEILDLTTRWAMDPVMIEIEPERVATDTIEQIVYLVTTEDKYKLLYNLVSLQGSEKVIVFSNRRDQVRKLADNLYRNGIDCGMLSGEIAQKKRIKTLEDFRTGNIKVLVATDVAGRGLHIDDVTHVINYTLPEEAEDYVHRIGRTGRAGASGTSISFACEEDSFLLPNIEDKLGQKLRCVHPDNRLLADTPEFSRASRFKDEDKAGKSGRSGKGGGSRSRSGSGSRSRNRRS